ncbi:hypothetical protein SAMN03159495_1839 [Pseudomonas sp. NFR16]|nr:hypothetical protein SAMN03159495_1839 [Pseudomonas sp. NFR16]
MVGYEYVPQTEAAVSKMAFAPVMTRNSKNPANSCRARQGPGFADSA